MRAGAGGALDELVIVHGTSDRPVASINVRDEAGKEEGVSVGAAAEKRGVCVDRGNAVVRGCRSSFERLQPQPLLTVETMLSSPFPRKARTARRMKHFCLHVNPFSRSM